MMVWRGCSKWQYWVDRVGLSVGAPPRAVRRSRFAIEERAFDCYMRVLRAAEPAMAGRRPGLLGALCRLLGV